MTKIKKVQEDGGLLGFSLIFVIFVLSIFAISSQNPSGSNVPNPKGHVLMGIYLVTWGIMFLSSYFYSHKTFFFRGLIWLCENFSNPRSKKMAFFYFALPTGIGLALIIKGISQL